jgi:hypothetical protein
LAEMCSNVNTGNVEQCKQESRSCK